MKELDREEKETILIGDTNCNFKSNHTGNAKKLKQIYAEFQFSQMINKYTRVAGTTKRILRADVLRIGMVDHYMVYGIRKVNAWRLKRKNKKKIVETRSLTKYDKISFINDLRQINWSTILSPLAENPNLIASTFQEIFESILDIHAPLKKEGSVVKMHPGSISP